MMSDSWKFRRETLDELIYHGVVITNEYRLPTRFNPWDIVIDIGAHIGSFTYAVVSRGCQQVFSLEPDRANFEIASEHLRPSIEKGFVKLVCAAAWRSDPNDDVLRYDGYHAFPKSFPVLEGILNTGSGSVMWGVGEPVPKLAFDSIIDQVTEQGEQSVRLLKLDCEGAEWPILLTSERLHLIDEICGEFHEIGGEFLEISEDRLVKETIFAIGDDKKFTIDRLVGFLNDAGFDVNFRRHQRPTGEFEGLGLFFAKRQGIA